MRLAAAARRRRAWRNSSPSGWCSRKSARRSPIPPSGPPISSPTTPAARRPRSSFPIRSPPGAPPRAASRADTKVGAADLKTIVRKNLILRLAVPRFFVQGDEVTISALVHNYLTDAKDGARLARCQRARRARRRHPRCRGAEPQRGARWIGASARSRCAAPPSPARRSPTKSPTRWNCDLPVNVPGVKLSRSARRLALRRRFGGVRPHLPGEGGARFALAGDPGVALDRRLAVRRARVPDRRSPTAAWSRPCRASCRTSSSRRRSAIWDSRPISTRPRSQEKIRAGLDRLYSFQHEDGGWGWWQTDESHPFMTAYVVAGLAQAQGAGVEVKQDAIDNGAAWVPKNVDPKLAADLRAYMAYALVLAGRTDAAGLGQVYAQRSKLSETVFSLFINQIMVDSMPSFWAFRYNPAMLIVSVLSPRSALVE